MEITPAIEITEDGSPTLRHPILGEYYHSMRGAAGESSHVFVEVGFRRACGQRGSSPEEQPLPAGNLRTMSGPDAMDGRDAPGNTTEAEPRPLRIFEMGFGSGLNALLTAREAETAARPVEYHAIELYPVSPDVAARLDYGDTELLAALHRAPWETVCPVTPYFSLRKIAASLPEYTFDTVYDLIYFDAFAPDAQPELWSAALFRKLWEQLSPGGALVTYSAKGTVKENLRAAGFEIQRLPGALGKRHMIRALKKD